MTALGHFYKHVLVPCKRRELPRGRSVAGRTRARCLTLLSIAHTLRCSAGGWSNTRWGGGSWPPDFGRQPTVHVSRCYVREITLFAGPFLAPDDPRQHAPCAGHLQRLPVFMVVPLAGVVLPKMRLRTRNLKQCLSGPRNVSLFHEQSRTSP